MASHPYISGAGNVTQMIGFLRKSFPASVNSDTVKKLGLASNNESYVINALQFLGIVNEEGKRTNLGQAVFAKHNDAEFHEAFQGLLREAYKDLFDLRGDEAWTLKKDDLINYFRSTDKTSEVIGTRQAGLFSAFRALAGYEQISVSSKATTTPKQAAKTSTSKPSKKKALAQEVTPVKQSPSVEAPRKDMALTVRIEINLPTEASAETYDNIFRSIRANLLND